MQPLTRDQVKKQAQPSDRPEFPAVEGWKVIKGVVSLFLWEISAYKNWIGKMAWPKFVEQDAIDYWALSDWEYRLVGCAEGDIDKAQLLIEVSALIGPE